MRDVRRIPRVLDKIKEVWLQNPDWRLGQLISNLQGLGPQDVFFAEDNVWEERLDACLEPDKNDKTKDEN